MLVTAGDEIPGTHGCQDLAGKLFPGGLAEFPVQGQEAEIRITSNGTQTARVGVAATVRMPPGR